MSNNILEIKNLRKSFGGLKAVDITNLNFERNKIISLIGPNGAGKTTFFDLITGFTKQDSGTTTFDGKNISNLESYKISRLGMVRTFQLTKVFDRMTVNENILFSASSLKNDRFINSLFLNLTVDKNSWGIFNAYFGLNKIAKLIFKSL